MLHGTAWTGMVWTGMLLTGMERDSSESGVVSHGPTMCGEQKMGMVGFSQAWQGTGRKAGAARIAADRIGVVGLTPVCWSMVVRGKVSSAGSDLFRSRLFYCAQPKKEYSYE